VNTKRWLQIVFGLGVGLLLIWWVFRDTDWGAVWASIRHVKIRWLLVNQAAVWATFFTRVQRWSYIVRAGDPATFRQMFSATQIGFLANFTLPGRIGEAVRALVLNRLARIAFSKSFAMVALDRVTDLIGLIVVMLVSVFAFRPTESIVLPREIYSKPISADLIRTGAIGTAVFLLAVVGTLVLLYVKQGLVLRLSDKCVGLVSNRSARRLHGMLEQFAQGLHIFRSASDMAKSISYSLATWGLFLIGYGAILAAFDVSWPWYAPFVVVSLLAVVIALPGAPGFVGQFHIALVVAAKASIPGLGVADAKAMAILAHLLNLIPIAIAGIFCLFWEDLRLRELTRASRHTDSL